MTDDSKDVSYFLTDRAERTGFVRNDRSFRLGLQQAMRDTPEITVRRYLSQTIISGSARLDFDRGICIEDGE